MQHILAIDDDTNLLKLLETQLKTLGFQVITAPTGAKGIKLADAGHPDLIILDIVMPDMNGFEVLKKLKRGNKSKDIPIIMLTSKKSKEDIIQAVRLGVTDYITKPYDNISLAKKVGAALLENQAIKAGKILKDSEHIEVIRRQEQVIIELKGSLNEQIILKQAESIFNSSFFTLTKYDEYILDLRTLPEITSKDFPVLLKFLKHFANHRLSIIGGRHYGTIITELELPENFYLFISYGDVEVFLSARQK